MRMAMVAIVTALVVGVAAFFGGSLFGRAQARANISQQFASFRNGGGFTPGGTNGNGSTAIRGGVAEGTIMASDGKSITIKLANGGSRIVYLSDQSRIVRSQDATSSDLTVGENVVVSGQAGSGGDITARSIQIVPKGFQGLGPGGFGRVGQTQPQGQNQ